MLEWVRYADQIKGVFMRNFRNFLVGVFSSLIGTAAFAVDGPDRWQLDRVGPNSMVKITVSRNGGTEKRYDPKYAWISDDEAGLKTSDLLIYCNPSNTKKMIAVRDLRYITNAVRKVTLSIGDEEFVGYAKEATVIFNTTNDYWSFKASDKLLSALRAGQTVGVQIFTPDITFDVGTFTLKGSSNAIKQALRGC